VAINQCLVVDNRTKSAKKPTPSVVIIDSQSVKNTATCSESVGFDGGKHIKWRKRFYRIDILGNLLDSFVVAANC
jgi:putative transposase